MKYFFFPFIALVCFLSDPDLYKTEVAPDLLPFTQMCFIREMTCLQTSREVGWFMDMAWHNMIYELYKCVLTQLLQLIEDFFENFEIISLI